MHVLVHEKSMNVDIVNCCLSQYKGRQESTKILTFYILNFFQIELLGTEGLYMIS